MHNQQSSPNLMPSRSNTNRDSTRILSNLSGNSRVVPARAKSAASRNKILASLTVLIILVGAATWFMQHPGIPALTPSATHTAAPTKTAPDTMALALFTLPEPQAAQIVNVPNTDDVSKNAVTAQITSPVKPDNALTENTTYAEKMNNAKPLEKTAKADQKPIAKNTAKNATPAPRSRKADDDTDVALLAALIQSTKPPASTKKTVPKKTPAVAK